jgi:hypothetical protein
MSTKAYVYTTITLTSMKVSITSKVVLMDGWMAGLDIDLVN